MENNNYEIATKDQNKIVINKGSENNVAMMPNNKEEISSRGNTAMTPGNRGEIYNGNNTAMMPSDGTAMMPQDESNSGLLVIKKQDLNSDYVKNRIREEKEAKIDFNQAERIPVSNNIFLNPIFYTAVCGLFSALIVWACVEPFVLTQNGKESTTALHIMVISLNMLLCGAISGLDGLMSGNFLKMFKNGGIGLACGLVWGIVGGRFLANVIMGLITILLALLFPTMINNNCGQEIPLSAYPFSMIARAPAWAFMGLGVGAIPGIANSSTKMTINGLIGGMLGGFLGGFLFDPISYITHTDATTGAGLSRCIGFATLGMLTGFFVGLVENMAKDVWVTMKSGPLRGKQFVIYHNPTLIGSSPKSDIYIFKDPNVMPTHAKITKKGSKYEISEGNLGSDIYVNSVKINGSKILEPNDTIIVGQSILEFQQKEKR